VFNTITGFGEASRMTQFKDKSAKQGADSASVGLFTYPILQAADILLYDAKVVPVGEDQRQHIELTRDIAMRFNSRFGQTLEVPEVRILKESAKVFDLQNPTAKMSKSGESPQGIIWLLDEPSVTAKKIKSAVTDTDRDIVFNPESKAGVSNLLGILSLLTGASIPALETEFAGSGYGDLKSSVSDAVVAEFEPIRARALELLSDPAELDRMLAVNAERANEIAEATLARVYDAVGFLPRA
jgi:tryptophanyl-tRNA synthetase